MAVTGWAAGDCPADGSYSAATDLLFGGRVSLEQPARGTGYRVNVDSLLLAAFASDAAIKRDRITSFDLGAGAGAVALAVLHLGGAGRVVLVEIDPVTAAMARRNLDENGWGDVSEVVVGDVRDVASARRGEAQLVVCNPPYVERGRGRPCADPARARARSGALHPFVLAAREVCGRRARVCFVYPARELSTLTLLLRGAGLEPKRLRFVHATARSRARIALVEAQAAKSGGLSVLPPLIEREGKGDSEEIAALLARGPRQA